ncbi:lymphocyte-specific helicase-like isoform X1 [Penaeus chinensis]|uniref:lymphocyte-specific helicase-like isoform X1 n=1 Tax=Penaeus chinensis TaxID=139456 RepID=UPI001FB6814D|nr:lymphocyte-specific helicase-like isoform X1 [Penaeus chinensis]XP_047489910.1 lymphocyte-specific helicase-like isoform X1 [Penaeus chinensis]XP_047489911.1 lymphocyte-specific helicase-like isoform X1 [Penaeus chinensis]
MPPTNRADIDEEVSNDSKASSESSSSTLSLSPARPEGSPEMPDGKAHGQSRMASPDSESKSVVENVLTTDIIAEEEKLELANDEQEKAWRKEVQDRAKEEEELKEKRYKRLMHLLSKSQFYSQFLLQQIENQDTKPKKGRKPKAETSTEKENVSTEAESSQDSEKSGSSRGRKRKNNSSAPAAKRVKDGKYNIEDVIDKETVEAKVEAGVYSEEDEVVEQVDQPRLFENGTMRSYQLEGFSWLRVLYENGVNGILGDEMGLGKTIQSIALLCHLIDRGVQGPFLVVAPLSTLPNWMSEFERFAPKVPTVLYHGSDAVRTEKRRMFQKLLTVEGTSVQVFPVVITSYEVVIRDTRFLSRYYWRYICVDEGHRIKNHNCRLTKSLNTFPSANRLLLTGTPLQNNLAELWSLLNFLMPEIFDSLDVFESWFDVTEMMEDGSDEKIIQQEREKQVIGTLQKILSPFFLRRMKKDVNLEIPPKKELLVYTPMTPLQLKLYEATLTFDYSFFDNIKKVDEKVEYDNKGRPKRKSKKDIDYSALLDESESPKSLDRFLDAVMRMQEIANEDAKAKKTSAVNIKLTNRMMQCRKIVNHPYLVNYPLTRDGEYMIDEGLLESCGKLQVLDQLLGELYKRKHRVLIFSQMTMMLDILEDYLSLRPKYKYKRLDGSKSLDSRQNDIKEYNSKDSNSFIFLLSTRAGGLGINLASADTVIIYDSDWNPQADLQAQDRCHRIGQTKPVLILRLITASTIDERIVERAATKRKLEKLIIQSGKFQASKQKDRFLDKVMDPNDLVTLLNQRDHERIHRTNTGNVFTKEELNQLLDRSDLIQKREGKEVPEKDLTGVYKVLQVGEDE